MKNIFINTIPHSGTHLVTTIVESLGYEHAIISNKFYTVKPYFRRKQKAGINWRQSKEISNLFPSLEQKKVLVSVASPRLVRSSLIKNMLTKILDGQYVIGHMPYSDDGKKVVENHIAKTITIIRDPRDMAISMINHSRSRPLHHAHHYLFNKLSNESERLEAVLIGFKNKHGSLIGINQMYTSMLQWKKQDNNLMIKFEDLVGEKGGGSLSKQLTTIRTITNHLELRDQISEDMIFDIAKNSFGVSGTFRKGKIGGWKSTFTHKDIELYKTTISDLLVDVGYEPNKDWSN